MRKPLLIVTMLLISLFLFAGAAFAADLETGKVKAIKTAEWADYENRVAKITLNVVGEPTSISTVGTDVVLVIDNSGSMGNEGSKVKDHTGTIESPQLIQDKTITNNWETKQTQTQTYSGICQECGKTVTYTRERTRTRTGIWNDWGPWSDWSTPNTTHSVYRMDIAKQAAHGFVDAFLTEGNPGNRIALVPFSSSDNSNHLQGVDFQTTVEALTYSINAMDAMGGTNYTDALTLAKSYLDGRVDQTRPAYVVFVSDGAPGKNGDSPDDPDWNGINQATALKGAGVTIYSVGIALPLGDAAALTALATVENGVPLYKDLQSVEDLTPALINVVGEIQNAGVDALMVDDINHEYFDLLTGTPGYFLPANVTINAYQVFWNIGYIIKAPQEIVLYVKLKEEYANIGNSYYTNTDVNLSYKDTAGQPQVQGKEEIGDPFVVVIGSDVPEDKNITIPDVNKDLTPDLPGDQNITTPDVNKDLDSETPGDQNITMPSVNKDLISNTAGNQNINIAIPVVTNLNHGQLGIVKITVPLSSQSLSSAREFNIVVPIIDKDSLNHGKIGSVNIDTPNVTRNLVGNQGGTINININ